MVRMITLRKREVIIAASIQLVVLATALLQGCIYVPRTTTVYDEECKTHTRQMTLQPEQIGHFGSCHGRDCVYVLVALGAVAAASAVVSGSIVVVGNVVYWLEKQGHCAIGRGDAQAIVGQPG